MNRHREISLTCSIDTKGENWPEVMRQRPPFCLSDLWRSPLHDLPLRDEVLYQYFPFSQEMEILEIGPGSGFTAFRLARLVKHLTLVDIAAPNIAHLKEQLHGLENVSFLAADVCAPGLTQRVGSKVDAVYGLEIFELLPDPATCLGNLASVLRPGGSMLLLFPNYPPPKKYGPTYFTSRDELDRLLSDAGFSEWTVSAVRLRPYTRFLYRAFHAGPLQMYRKVRRWNGEAKPLTYERSWAFAHRSRLDRYKVLLHGYWAAWFAAARLGGACFERRILQDGILHHNLLLLARR